MFELTETQRAIQETARWLAQSEIAPNAAEVDRTEEYPWDNVQKLTDAGFMGMTIPKEYGGQGASYMDAMLVVEEMAKVCGVTGRIAVEGNMGGVGAVMRYGTEEQKQLAAGLVLAGDKPAICITEPGAGSAATEMTTRAVKKGAAYVLNGTKHWITGAGVSKLHVIFARVIEDGEDLGIGGFIAVRDETPGLKIGRRELAMGLRGIPEGEIIMEDMEVPETMMIVPPEGIRRGFAGLMNAYNAQRVGAATVALGIAEGAYELALEYSQEREQFGRPICEFQGLHWMLADMSIQLAAAQALVYKAATSAETTGSGFPDPLMAAQAKVFTADAAIKVANDALQVFGAMGYARSLPLERMARDARMFTIGGGTAQVLRTMVASRILDRKLPQTRDGFTKLAEREAASRDAAE
ncbi:MAG: acyl-CoA dehydrogenase family protein [Magnetovibrio sp.]|nr:acyl-CoA dehydrogenase family protein [Magnetovibrio sp.]